MNAKILVKVSPPMPVAASREKNVANIPRKTKNAQRILVLFPHCSRYVNISGNSFSMRVSSIDLSGIG